MNELEIFSAAVEIQDSTDRKKFLEQACGDNTDLLRSVETLLQSAASGQASWSRRRQRWRRSLKQRTVPIAQGVLQPPLISH